MKKVKVFQIGLGSFGRQGFEKFIEMDLHHTNVSVELVAVYDRDPTKLEKAQKFADFNGVAIDTYTSIDEIYTAAKNTTSGKTLIYDAGPTDLHAEHIYRSLKNGFFHLAEKPPSMTRSEHIKEKKMVLDSEVRYTVDFIERENPAVKKAIKLVKESKINSLEVFRESCMGLEKLLKPVERSGVKGGAVIDKMCHEAYLMDIFDEELKLKSVEKKLQMPYGMQSDSLMGIRGDKKFEEDSETASGICSAEIDAGADLKLNASWLGISKSCRNVAQKIESITEHNPIRTGLKTVNGRSFMDEEARFFLLEGDKNLFCDMLHKKLFDLETGEEIEVMPSLHDQLYRVIESSVHCAAGLESNNLSEEKIDRFMNLIFDISEHTESIDTYEEVEKANNKVRSMMIETENEADAKT